MAYIKDTANGTAVFHTDNENQRGIDRFGYLNRLECKAHYSVIDNTRKLKALIREGRYAFPGGYAVIPYTSDGGILCLDCIKENISNCLWSIRNSVSDGWRVVGLDTYHGEEDNGQVVCDNCGKDWEEI